MATSDSTKNSSLEPGTLHNQCLGERQPIAAAAGGLVKCNEDGDLDWRTLGKVLTASVLGEAFCASYADYKHGRMTRGSNVDIDWKFAYEEKGILVLKKNKPSDNRTNSQNIICFAGRGVLDYPVKQVAAVIANSDNFSNWNRFLTESRVIRVLSDTDTTKQLISYFVHENSRCLVRAKRDFLLYLNAVHTEDGMFVHSAISIDHPCCPPVEGVTRAQCCLGSGWVLEPYEGNTSKTLATYIANIDLCTPLPPSMTSRLLQQQPLTIYYLKKFLKSTTKIYRGLSLRNHPRVSDKIDSEFETSVTSTFRAETTVSFPFVDDQAKSYFEPMGVDHFMGVPTYNSKTENIFDEEDGGYSSISTSKSDIRGRSSSASSQTPYAY